jgi:hypothetical protein
MIIQLNLFVFLFILIKCNTENTSNLIDKYKDCKYYYLRYIQPIQNRDNEIVSFEEYIDYWWNFEEKKEDFMNKICLDIILKYKKRFLRNKNIY